MAEQVNLEDEMSRFEQEILGSGPSQSAPGSAPPGTAPPGTVPPGTAPAAPVIGASTFTSVQEQLTALRAQVYGGGGGSSNPVTPQRNERTNVPLSTDKTDQRLATQTRLAAPPRPPGFRPPAINGVTDSSNAARPMTGPPPPPPRLTAPPRPSSFLPPQLRMRAGPPEPSPNNGQSMQRPQSNFHGPPRPPMQAPPMRPPAMMPPQLRPPPGMMPGLPTGGMPMIPPNIGHSSVSGQPVRYTPVVTAAPKVVYSSKPVINKPSKKTATETDKAEPTSLKRDASEHVSSGTSANQVDLAAASSTSNVSINDAVQPPAKKEKKTKVVKEKKFVRTAANDVWEDQSLADWDPNDFRVFCGDLGNEVTDEKLAEAFKKYPSLQKAKVVRDKRTHKTKGYGFISFKDPTDYTRAMREMNGKYVGNRPIKLRKSNWKDRNVEVVKKKEREKKKLGFR